MVPISHTPVITIMYDMKLLLLYKYTCSVQIRLHTCVVYRKLSNFSATCISGREQVNFQWDDDEVNFVLDQHA